MKNVKMDNILNKIKIFLNAYNKPASGMNLYKIILLVIFALGLFLRLKAYFMNLPLWLDESSLAVNVLHRNILGYFTPLENIQSAPPFFMMVSHAFTSVFGISEYSLRLFPLIASCASLFVFYIFSKHFIKSRWCILLANLVFAVNIKLIYFAEEFKQYSSDVLIFMLGLMFINKIELEKMSFKKSLLAGFVLFFLLLFSMPSIFLTGAFIIYSLKNFKKKVLVNIGAIIIPFLCLGPFYYFFNLLPTRKLMVEEFLYQWESGFMHFFPPNIIPMLYENLWYLFDQKSFWLFGAILLIWGVVILFKHPVDKKMTNLLFLSLALALLASFCDIYPIKTRLSLYMISPVIVFLLKSLDIFSLKKKLSSMLSVVLCLIFFSSYNPALITGAFNDFAVDKRDGRTIMKVLKENFKQDEIVICNYGSETIYAFYSALNEMYTKNFIMIKMQEYSKEYYTGLLNELPKGHTYWLYYAHDFPLNQVIPFVKEWKKDKNVLEEHESFGSYLLKVKI